MRSALILAAALLAAPVQADGLQFTDPAEDAAAIRLCAGNSEVPLADRLKCGDPVFEACRFRIAADNPDEDWRVVYVHCLEQETRAWDEVVNTVYGEVREGARDRRLDGALRQAQQKWIAWRDAKCSWKDPILKGNDGAFARMSCLRSTAALRSIELIDDLAFFR